MPWAIICGIQPAAGCNLSRENWNYFEEMGYSQVLDRGLSISYLLKDLKHLRNTHVYSICSIPQFTLYL